MDATIYKLTNCLINGVRASKMEIKKLDKKDFNKVIYFAIKGMNFEEYLKNNFLLKAYGRYFWYLEYSNATQVIAAYEGEELLGVLIADMKDEFKPYKSFWKGLYIGFVDFIQKVFFKGGVMPYNEANKMMYYKYRERNAPDGEIRFLAANPDNKRKGVGTFLLEELIRRETNKEIYLFTDTNCNYQFYEHRGFERVGEQEIMLELSEGVEVKCLLYRKCL